MKFVYVRPYYPNTKRDDSRFIGEENVMCFKRLK